MTQHIHDAKFGNIERKEMYIRGRRNLFSLLKPCDDGEVYEVYTRKMQPDICECICCKQVYLASLSRNL